MVRVQGQSLPVVAKRFLPVSRPAGNLSQARQNFQFLGLRGQPITPTLLDIDAANPSRPPTPGPPPGCRVVRSGWNGSPVRKRHILPASFPGARSTPGPRSPGNWLPPVDGTVRGRGQTPEPLHARLPADSVRAGEKLGQERRESGGPWRSKNRPPEICLRKRSQEERFVGYRRDVHSGAICTRSARGLC